MELAKPKLFKELIRKRPITFDDGWRFIHNGIMKLENFIDGTTELKFCSEEYSNLYTVIYSMCTQRRPYDHCQQLYDKYKESNKEYIQSTVLPSLREKHGQYLLRELVERWGTYNLRVRWLSHFFQYLDRYFISRNELPSLKEVGLACFRDMVFQELSVSVKDAVISIIYQEREGEQIDSSLLKKVQDILVEIGNGKMNYFENGFEAHLLMDTSESVTSCFQGVEGFSFCGEANSEQKSKSGLPGKMGLGKMSGWMGTWEQADVLTGVAVIGAVVTIAMAYSFYRRSDIPFLRLDGTLNQQQREKVIKQFSEDSNVLVLLMSLKAGGVGISPTAASNAYVLDPWWNPAVEEQAIMHIHRIGQTKKVTIKQFIVKSTVEERMEAVQARKQRMISGTLTDQGVRTARIEELKMLFT